MNATSLYVSTCRLVLQANAEDISSWTDLYRLVPYLRQSLSCTVCGNLLIEPYTPTETNCQHHVCRSCKGGKKKLKPSCSWCKDYDKYIENVQLRILLQCYKKLCEYITSTLIYRNLVTSSNDGGSGTSSLIELIQEGAGFKDDFKSTGGLSKSAYSILPCIYTSTSTQTAIAAGSINQEQNSLLTNDSICTVSNGSPMYSVMYAGSGNKITIKKKAIDADSEISDGGNDGGISLIPVNNSSFKKPQRTSKLNGNGTKANSVSNKRKGCRCGNATATPGKLTCCGQRCPCYVESKACIECRCRGCRNPHRPGGHKVRPLIPELHNYQLHLTPTPLNTEDNLTTLEPQQCLTSLANSTVQVLGVYTQLPGVNSSLPGTIIMDENIPSTESSADENSDVEVDI